MNTFHSSLYAIAFACCVLLLVVANRSPAAARARGLVALLALQSLSFACEWLMANPASPAKALWLTGVMALAFGFGPLLWLYARSIDESVAPRWRDLPRTHLVPIAIGGLLLLPLLWTAHSGTEFTNREATGTGWLSQIIHETMLASVAVFALQALFYLRASMRILRRHAGLAKALFSDIVDRDLNALRLMIIVVGAHWLVGIARTLHPLLLGKDAGYVILFAMCEVMFMLWAARELLVGTPAIDAADRRLANELVWRDVAARGVATGNPASAGSATGQAANASAATEAGEPGHASVPGARVDLRYAKSALDAPTRARIARKLADAWTGGLHRDSRLTLRLLCEHLRESPHYVSQVINQDLGTTFYDLVNRQRIADATRALTRTPDRPVIEIALEVGFNSKSTFNAAFRQHAGTTPTGFRKAARAPEPAGTTQAPS